jgi:mono/diheme cytochrome c family protein
MMISWKSLLPGILCLAWLLAGCGGQETASPVPTLERPQPPAEYADKSNPYGSETAAVEAGKNLYQKNCVTCHGETGMGDGPAAESLNPHPQTLAVNQESLDDGYLFWRISEGGLRAPFSSAMPSWKTILSEDEIWQVISYLRTMSN